MQYEIGAGIVGITIPFPRWIHVRSQTSYRTGDVSVSGINGNFIISQPHSECHSVVKITSHNST